MKTTAAKTRCFPQIIPYIQLSSGWRLAYDPAKYNAPESGSGYDHIKGWNVHLIGCLVGG